MPIDRSEIRPNVPRTILTRPPTANAWNSDMRPRPVLSTSQNAASPQGIGAPENRNLGVRSPSGLPAPLRIVPPSDTTASRPDNPRRWMPPAPLHPTATRWPGTQNRVNMGNMSIPYLPKPSQLPQRAPPTPTSRAPTPPLRILAPPPRAPPAPRAPPVPRAPPAPRVPPTSRNSPTSPVPSPTSSRPPARLFTHLSHQSEQPDFSRLDIPNEHGRSLYVIPSGGLSVRTHRPDATSQASVSINPDGPLPNSQYDKYPMIIQVAGRPCVLYGPLWDKDTSRPMSGDQCFLSDQEREKRRVYRARAHQDLQRYGSPAWLAQDSINET